MSEKRYELWTRLCLLAAVGSAIAFDKLGHLGWVAGAVGIASGVTGASLYFWQGGKAAQKPQRQHDGNAINSAMQPAPTSSPEYAAVDPKQLGLWASTVAVPCLWPNVAFDVQLGRISHEATLRYWKAHYEVLHVRNEKRFVDQVVEIVERLSPTCEFELDTTDGRLLIHPRPVSKHEFFSFSSGEPEFHIDKEKEQVH